jgi:hypothetical protein
MRKRQRVERGFTDHDVNCTCSNCDRARSGQSAITAFANQRGLAAADDANTVSDLICCLGHYCDVHGLDFIMTVQRGVGFWRTEMEGPDEHAVKFTAKLSITPRRVV